MRRFFVKNLFFVLFVNVLVMPVWVFLIDNTVQNRVGPQEYGTYNSLFSLGLIFSIILDFGITQYNTRSIAQNPDQLKTFFPAMLSARLMLMVVYAAILMGIGVSLGYQAWEMMLLGGIVAIHSLTNLVAFIRSNVSALHHFKVDSLLAVSGRLLMIVVCGFLLVYPPTGRHFKIEWFVASQVACYFITAVISLAVLNRLHPVSLRFSFHGATLLKIIKDTLPYASVIFLMYIYNRSDSWLLKELCADKEQAGIYAASYRWLDVGNSFAITFSAILLPLYGRMLAEKQDIKQLVQLCVNLLLPISLMVSVGAVFYGHDFMHWRYAAATNYYGDVFQWVMGSFPAICMMYIYSTLLLANGNLKTLNWLALGGSILNLLLNFYIIPRYQALGAGVTSFITQWCMTIGFVLCCMKQLQLTLQVKWLLTLGGFLLLVGSAGYLTNLLPLHWMVKAGGFAAVSFILMFAFRFVSVHSVKQLLSGRQR